MNQEKSKQSATYIRQAAEALNMRQSTLSRRLHAIARKIGMVLFERTNGGTRLATVGLEFVASAELILDDVDAELQRSRSRGNIVTAALFAPLEEGEGGGMQVLPDPHYRHRFRAELISHAVWLYHVFSPSLRDVELLLAERGISVSYETIRRWLCTGYAP